MSLFRHHTYPVGDARAARAHNRPSWRLLYAVDIPCADDPRRVLLRRWRIIETPVGGLMVHHLICSDWRGRGLHDHPWTFLSLTVRGSYREWRGDASGIARLDRPHRWRFRRATDQHAVVLDDPIAGAWSLVAHGPRRREWGFQTRDGWIPWHAFTPSDG